MSVCTICLASTVANRFAHAPGCPGDHPGVEHCSTVVRREDDGWWATAAGRPGCFASGATPEEALAALREAVEMYDAPASPEVRGTDKGESHG